MFETVVPETFHRRSRRVFYETLPVSIALHAIAIAGFAAVTLWTVVFPSQSPRMTVPYNLTSLPEPPPPPPPLPRGHPAAVKEPRSLPPPRPTQVVAPTIIPDTIPTVVDPPPPPPDPVPVMAPPAPVPAGVPEAGAGGVLGADLAGKLRGTVGGLVFADDGRVHIDRNEKLPLKVIEQGYPHYPDEARKQRLDDRVVVRYTVGTNGRVTEITILEHAKEPMFDQETVETVRLWRFRPLTLDGRKAEVVHEVEVNFEFLVR